jgi:hypothetical protein
MAIRVAVVFSQDFIGGEGVLDRGCVGEFGIEGGLRGVLEV